MLANRGVALIPFVEELRDAGVTLMQYRDKLGSREQILHNAKAISEVFRGREVTLVMNDSPALAQLVGLNAVHVGQDDAAVADARAVLRSGSIVGCSTHTEEQVIAADATDADYIAIGPVFATSTKLNAEPVVGLEGVRRARALTNRPLVAIGGITPQNAASVIEAGADTVAVVGALLQGTRSPTEAIRMFLDAMPR